MLPCDMLPWKQTANEQQMSNGGMPVPGMGKRKMSVVDRLMSAIGIEEEGDAPESQRVREKKK